MKRASLGLNVLGFTKIERKGFMAALDRERGLTLAELLVESAQGG